MDVDVVRMILIYACILSLLFLIVYGTVALVVSIVRLIGRRNRQQAEYEWINKL